MNKNPKPLNFHQKEILPSASIQQVTSSVMNVPLIQAPTQVNYVKTKITQQQSRRWAWGPFFLNLAHECGGWRMQQCKYHESYHKVFL